MRNLKALIDRYFWIVLKYVKQKVDKSYYARYDAGNRDELIRRAFPGITRELGYDKLNEYLITHQSSDMRAMINMLMSFYWAEVARMQAEERFAETVRYQGIVDFCSALKAYAEEADILNNQQ